jgi:hypothetical protein
MTLSPAVYKTATLMIQEYGEFAPAGAFIKADQLRDAGDIAGREIWLRIARAAEELLSEDRPQNSVLH